MSRKLFCEISPLTYKISEQKGIIIRHFKNLFGNEKIARVHSKEELPNIVKSHSSILVRKLYGVDIKLQKSKVKNIELACKKINGIIIHPGETFSFWCTVGKATKKNGYQEGLVISKKGLTSGYGGGLCQMANMIHWLILNSPLQVTELHHHTDALFPDDRRRVPFGTGTSVCYNYIDYKFKNTTDQNVQILVWIENGELCGELRSEREYPNRYKLVEENHHFRKENNKYYRISQVYRIVIDRETNKEIAKELILDNHSEVLYDYSLIPEEQIRDDELIKRIEKTIKEYPNRIAYRFKSKKITYKELWNKANKYAKLLKKQGTSPVIIYGHKDIEVIVSIISCLLANRTYVPVGICTPVYRLRKIVNLTKSTLVLTEKKIKIKDADCIKLSELKKYAKKEETIINNNIVYIIFTSGSTGIPKGVPISKRNLNNFIDWIIKIKPLDKYKNINVLNQSSFSFDLSVADLYYSLCNGHTLIAIDNHFKNGYEELFKTLKEIDVAVVTPTFIKLCILNQNFNSNNYKKLKCIYSCGEQLEVKTVKKLFELFPKLEIINAYGPTEATSAVAACRIKKEMLKDKILPVGEMNNLATKVEIIKNEIVLKGNSVFNGYIDNYEGGHYKENNINCYKTGDTGYIKDQKLYCKGRKDGQIKYKGYRIELNDIENNINQIKGVIDCAVIAKYNEESIVKTIKAFVVLNDNINIEYIKTELKKYLPDYMIPKTITILDKLPINQNGKIDRKALAKYE